jgi:hypothetical protein
MATFGGADTSIPLSQDRYDQAKQFLAAQPLTWGRYFNGFHTTSAEYLPSEAPLFRSLGLKLVPVAQQTPKVGGKEDDGAANATMNVQKFITRLGADHLAANGTEYLMFLDVEGDPAGGNPSMSAAYYKGWSTQLVAASRAQSLGRFTIVPGVYARTKDNNTWNALLAAEAEGAERCRGVWTTRTHTNACTQPARSWEASFLTPPIAINCPVFCWQFAIDCPDGNGIDADLLNPDDTIRKTLLDRLIVPAP